MRRCRVSPHDSAAKGYPPLTLIVMDMHNVRMRDEVVDNAEVTRAARYPWIRIMLEVLDIDDLVCECEVDMSVRPRMNQTEARILLRPVMNECTDGYVYDFFTSDFISIAFDAGMILFV